MSSTSAKRKRVVLNIEQKVNIIRKVEQGVPRQDICRYFNIGKTTVVDILKSKDNLFKFYAGTETNKFLTKRKTLSTPKLALLDEAVWEWYKMKRNDGKGKPIHGYMIIEQAKEMYTKMKIK